MKPLLTVAIPTYNGGNNLIRAIRSCKYINLPTDEFEILVVDNCSTDDSITKLRQLQDKFINLRIVINDRNYGRVGNWNRCIELAKGKYIIFLFSNDQISKENDILGNINFMIHKNIYLSIQPYKKRKENNESINRLLFLNSHLLDFKEFLIGNLNKFNFPFAPIQSNIYNLDVIKKYNIKFREEFDLNGDQLFTIEVGLKSKNILYYPFPQIVWEYNHNRFHSKVSILKVITDDFKLLEYLQRNLMLKIDYEDIICYAFIRVLRNNEWKQSNKYKSYFFIIKKIFIYKSFKFLISCLKKFTKKLTNIITRK
jgi:glycosyltransferase involved in cell wall biosynthesis